MVEHMGRGLAVLQDGHHVVRLSRAGAQICLQSWRIGCPRWLFILALHWEALGTSCVFRTGHSGARPAGGVRACGRVGGRAALPLSPPLNEGRGLGGCLIRRRGKPPALDTRGAGSAVEIEGPFSGPRGGTRPRAAGHSQAYPGARPGTLWETFKMVIRGVFLAKQHGMLRAIRQELADLEAQLTALEKQLYSNMSNALLAEFWGRLSEYEAAFRELSFLDKEARAHHYGEGKWTNRTLVEMLR
ncbi:hypothetical protein NDU88_001140 [Pleurodeles waltl]|uniref:Uncharacterized protein n=1 Tax=Pleurodeles waltl TaxID=8319 RepID=A0AAV7SA52_PLEWA|nr:hypothetical protein NDU88_001140 [Pleurodeles waltl]